MKTFKNWNWGEWKCPLCDTNNDWEVILVPIIGTQEGNLVEAKQIHTKCLERKITWDEKNNILYAIK